MKNASLPRSEKWTETELREPWWEVLELTCSRIGMKVTVIIPFNCMMWAKILEKSFFKFMHIHPQFKFWLRIVAGFTQNVLSFA